MTRQSNASPPSHPHTQCWKMLATLQRAEFLTRQPKMRTPPLPPYSMLEDAGNITDGGVFDPTVQCEPPFTLQCSTLENAVCTEGGIFDPTVQCEPPFTLQYSTLEDDVCNWSGYAKIRLRNISSDLICSGFKCSEFKCSGYTCSGFKCSEPKCSDFKCYEFKCSEFKCSEFKRFEIHFSFYHYIIFHSSIVFEFPFYPFTHPTPCIRTPPPPHSTHSPRTPHVSMLRDEDEYGRSQLKTNMEDRSPSQH